MKVCQDISHSMREDIYACPVCDDPKLQENREMVLGVALYLVFAVIVGTILAVLI